MSNPSNNDGGGEIRHMNDTTMPPPKTSSTTRKTAVNPRQRIGGGLKKGFGLHDWKLLLRNTTDLAQRKGQPIRRDITKEEVRKHNKLHDGWIVLRGKVYNLGPYLHYHPGGVDILKGVLGKDATSLFDKYHRWVNIDGLIGPLLLGSIGIPKSTAAAAPLTTTAESSLSSAPPRVLPVPTTSSALTLGKDEDEEDEDDDNLLLPPPPPRK